LLTVIVRWTCGAAMYWALPAWLASITQLPTAPKVTVFPDREHTPGPLDEATEKTTGLPEPPPVADKCAEDNTVPAGGAVKEIDCGSLPTEIVRWTCGAAAYLALPAWLASMTQLPPPVKVTEFPDTVHAFPPPEAAENTTGLPEPPPVADKCAEPRTFPDAGAVREIDWGINLTVIVRWTWGAAVYCALPAWLASMTQLPAAMKVTEVPDTVHALEPPENTTGLPEPPPVADRCAEPPAIPDAGAVKEIDWVCFGRAAYMK
jgi:hypothetical protein